MGDLTRAVLHEVMEQQTVSIAKAGIICTLNARTSILASANPRESRYNPNLSVIENLQLPPTLLSRFDLIYLVLDKPNEETDRNLAKHLISLYWGDRPKINNVIPINKLTRYIAYARAHCNPILSKEACDILVSVCTQSSHEEKKIDLFTLIHKPLFCNNLTVQALTYIFFIASLCYLTNFRHCFITLPSRVMWK